MKMPPNSIPMVGGAGKYDYITMGGMFTILKVRESLPGGYDADPGWYDAPAGTLAALATDDAMRRNKIASDASSAPRNPAGPINPSAQATPTQGHSPHNNGSGGGHPMSGDMQGMEGMKGASTTTAAAATTAPAVVYTCSMHPEVRSDKPGKCPKCGMKLIVKK